MITNEWLERIADLEPAKGAASYEYVVDLIDGTREGDPLIEIWCRDAIAVGAAIAVAWGNRNPNKAGTGHILHRAKVHQDPMMPVHLMTVWQGDGDALDLSGLVCCLDMRGSA